MGQCGVDIILFGASIKNRSALYVLFCCLVILLSAGGPAFSAGSNNPVYKLAAIKIKYPDETEDIRMHPNNDIKVFSLDARAKAQGVITLPFEKRAAKILPDGRIMSYIQEKVPGKKRPHNKYFISNAETCDIRKAAQGQDVNTYLSREEAQYSIPDISKDAIMNGC